MRRDKLISARESAGLTQAEVAEELRVSIEAYSTWERGIATPHRRTRKLLADYFGSSEEELDLAPRTPIQHEGQEQPLQNTSTSQASSPALWTDDLLTIYTRGVAACQDLYYNGNPHQVEAILPLYSQQTALLAEHPGILQRSAARLAAQIYQLASELATDREDFGKARQAGQQAFSSAQLAGDSNLQVTALISLANLSWHLSSAQPCFVRKHSKDALQAYQQAVSLLNNNVTPLLKGRVYAGLAEVYAMRGQDQEAMRAMGYAYEHFPLKPEDDPAYPYLRASRYALYVFGDAQTRLLLNQPQKADDALILMLKETNDPEVEPITKLDMLYYQAEVQIQQRELGQSTTLLTEAATLAKHLGSRLYFNKLAASYCQLEEQWPKEPVVSALEEIFQPW